MHGSIDGSAENLTGIHHMVHAQQHKCKHSKRTQVLARLFCQHASAWFDNCRAVHSHYILMTRALRSGRSGQTVQFDWLSSHFDQHFSSSLDLGLLINTVITPHRRPMAIDSWGKATPVLHMPAAYGSHLQTLGAREQHCIFVRLCRSPWPQRASICLPSPGAGQGTLEGWAGNDTDNHYGQLCYSSMESSTSRCLSLVGMPMAVGCRHVLLL
jgi:hypothetical protein